MINNDPNNVETVFRSPEFQELLKKVEGHTVVTPDRLLVVHELACNYKNYPCAEVGVFKGGTGYILLSKIRNVVYLMDTFEGMPETENYEFHKKGDFDNTSYKEVKNYLSEFDNKVILKGLFSESKSLLPYSKYGLVHLDADIYSTTIDCLEYFYDKMIVGGAILLDDFDFGTTPGCKIAVNKFLEEKPEHCMSLGTGQGLIIKQ